jgi:hypothetical protein
MGTAILWVSITAWIVCFLIYLGALLFIDGDISSLRAEMAARAAVEKAGASPMRE